MAFVTNGKGRKINIEDSELWYHGSQEKLIMLRVGSSITKNKELARAFSHRPSKVWVDDDGKIKHNGTEKGYLYIIDEPIREGDLKVHEVCTEDDPWELITTRELRLKEIPNCKIKGVLLE